MDLTSLGGPDLTVPPEMQDVILAFLNNTWNHGFYEPQFFYLCSEWAPNKALKQLEIWKKFVRLVNAPYGAPHTAKITVAHFEQLNGQLFLAIDISKTPWLQEEKQKVIYWVIAVASENGYDFSHQNDNYIVLVKGA